MPARHAVKRGPLAREYARLGVRVGREGVDGDAQVRGGLEGVWDGEAGEPAGGEADEAGLETAEEAGRAGREDAVGREGEEERGEDEGEERGRLRWWSGGQLAWHDCLCETSERVHPGHLSCDVGQRREGEGSRA